VCASRGKEKQGILLQSASTGKGQEKLIGKKNGVQFGAAIRGKYNVKETRV